MEKQTYLEETYLVCVLSEAPAAYVQAVLANNAYSAGAYSTTPRSFPIILRMRAPDV